MTTPAPLPRRVPKPWGHELIFALTDRYCGKILVIEAGKRLSLQYHERKDEWIHVLAGQLQLLLEDAVGTDRVRLVGPGESAHIAPGRRHRFEAVERCEIVEVSTPELEDVIRLSDDFGREGTSLP